MKAKISLFVLLALVFQINFCNAQDICISKIYGGSGLDYSYDIQPTSDGGFIVTGQTSSTDHDVVGNHGNSDYWVLKLDADLNIVWKKALGGDGIERQSASVKEVTGSIPGYVVFGTTTSSNNGDVGQNNGIEDLWLVKLDLNGNILWAKTYGSTAQDNGHSYVEPTSDGGFIISGDVKGNIIINGTPSIGYHTGTNEDGSPTDDALVAKLDSDGNIVWAKLLGGSQIDYSGAVLEVPDGFVMVGGTYSTDGDVTGKNTAPGDDNADMWVVKLNKTNGNIIWTKAIGGSAYEFANSIIQSTVDNSFIILGTTMSDDFFTTVKNTTHTINDYDYCLLSLSTDGTTVNWCNNYGGSGDDMSGVVKESSDGYVISGFSTSSDGNITDHHGGYDFWLLKVDKNTRDISSWTRSFGGSGDDWNTSLCLTPGGGIVLAGLTNSTDGDLADATLPHYGDYDYWILKYCMTTMFLDADGDGFGNAAIKGCGVKYVLNSRDCNDHNNLIHPGAFEKCDGIDYGCDGRTDMDNNIIVNISTPCPAIYEKGDAYFFTASVSNNPCPIAPKYDWSITGNGANIQTTPAGTIIGNLQTVKIFTTPQVAGKGGFVGPNHVQLCVTVHIGNIVIKKCIDLVIVAKGSVTGLEKVIASMNCKKGRPKIPHLIRQKPIDIWGRAVERNTNATKYSEADLKELETLANDILREVKVQRKANSNKKTKSQ